MCATDESYQKARQSMAQAEEETRSRGAIVIKAGGRYLGEDVAAAPPVGGPGPLGSCGGEQQRLRACPGQEREQWVDRGATQAGGGGSWLGQTGRSYCAGRVCWGLWHLLVPQFEHEPLELQEF